MGKQQQQAKKKSAKTSRSDPPTPVQKAGPPFAISDAEYRELREQVEGLSLEEIQEEWILAARHGDLDVLHAILAGPQYRQNAGRVVNCQDAQNGNTALHMAAANGNVPVVETLLDHCRPLPDHSLVNRAGNTPLHWAAANGHDEVVELLLRRIPDIDVLQRNEFGRSALTEGFASQKTEVIKHLLEHDSAAEEKLLQGGQEVDVEEHPSEVPDQKPTESSKPAASDDIGIVHEFNFQLVASPNQETENLRVRELPIPISHDPFGDRPELDTTGYGIWAASLVMARWMVDSSDRLRGKRLLELGAGCGVPGLAVAFYSDAKEVYLTDLNPTTLDNLQYNIQLNQQRTGPAGTAWMDRLHAGPINWEDSTTWPNEKMDFIIGSDLIYQSSIVPFLKNVVLGLCQGQGTFLYVAPDIESDIGRDGLTEFIHEMESTEGCEMISDRPPPQSYQANPLASQDDDVCYMHFNELTSGAYRLYEFRINVQK